MLRIYPIVLDMLRALRPSVEGIERRDADLGKQLRRASASVALNIAEGSGCTKGSRTARYSTALGSMQETIACLEVAEALGYLPGIDAAMTARFNHIVGVLVRLTHSRR